MLKTNNKGNVIPWTDPGRYSMFEVLLTHGTICHLCDRPIDMVATRKVGYYGWENGLHLDHVIPLSKGGLDTLENVKPAHARCNINKGAMTKPYIPKYTYQPPNRQPR